MTEAITKAMKRPGVVPAFLAGLGVFAALLVISFLKTLFSTLSVIATAPIAGDYVGQIWTGLLVGSVTGPLPFAIGVFLCFWQVAPIAPVLRLAHVVTRSILAALLGGAVIWIVSLVFQVVVEVSNTQFSTPAGDVLAQLGPDALQSLFGALAATVGYLPIVVLAGILLWGWLQRHPLGTRVHGALDEV
ncbi:MAG TPA: hypothetical protein VGM38_06395 [Pseudolysinimonas sp.]|jgi:hypothetical protein